MDNNKKKFVFYALMSCIIFYTPILFFVAYKLAFDENTICHFNQGNTKAQIKQIEAKE